MATINRAGLIEWAKRQYLEGCDVIDSLGENETYARTLKSRLSAEIAATLITVMASPPVKPWWRIW